MKLSDLFDDYCIIDDFTIRRLGQTNLFCLVMKDDGQNMTRILFKWEAVLFKKHNTESRRDIRIRNLLIWIINHNRYLRWRSVKYMDDRYPDERLMRLWPEEYERALVKQREKQKQFEEYMKKQREIRKYREKNNIPW